MRGEGKKERDETRRENRQNWGMVCVLLATKLRGAKNIVGIWPSRDECISGNG